MRSRLTTLGFTFLLFSLLSSCGKKATEPIEKSRTEDFPNSVGFLWIYEVYDSLAGATDTVTVEITDTLTLAGVKPATIWVYTYSDAVDTHYVVVWGDTVLIYPGQDTTYMSAKYIFPLEIDKSWRYRWADNFRHGYFKGVATTTVVGEGLVSTPAGSFQNAFSLNTRIEGDVVFYDDGLCFLVYVLEVGVVCMHRIIGPDIDTASVWETWDLISYELTS